MVVQSRDCLSCPASQAYCCALQSMILIEPSLAACQEEAYSTSMPGTIMTHLIQAVQQKPDIDSRHSQLVGQRRVAHTELHVIPGRHAA